MNIIEAIHSKKFFRSCFKDLATWVSWMVLLKALFTPKMGRKELAKCLGMNYLALTNSLRLDLTSLYAMIPKKNRRRVKTIDFIDFTALTAADWAKRKGMGEEAIHYCRSYTLEAERKMGEMLAQTERNVGAQGIGISAVTKGDHTPPTLSDLGLTNPCPV